MAQPGTKGRYHVDNLDLQPELEVWCAACRLSRAASPDKRKFERATPSPLLLELVGRVIDNLLLKATYADYPAADKQDMRQQALTDFFRWGHNFSPEKTVHSRNPAFTYVTNNAERSIKTYLAKTYYKWVNTMATLGNEEVRSGGQYRVDSMLTLMAGTTTHEDVLDLFREAQSLAPAHDFIQHDPEDI